ncbi:hypothetical protein [Neobacillus niacini]|uniref:hypothetical protein n=1 Tax=Neobacillus niacini TaxID=86668 RepID=UPI0021CB02F7|nr:hypothetical protein [Neobacillus niacini]MCM3763435.1 hypothetical protein [Neobacillus niacini]
MSRFRESNSTKANKKQEDWISPTLLNGWTGTFRYRKNSIGQVEYQGVIVVGTGTTGTTIMTLPTEYRNGLGMHILHAFDGSSGAILPIRIRDNGDVVLAGTFTTGRSMHLSGAYATT